MGWTTSQRSTVDHKGVWYVSCLQYKHIIIIMYIMYTHLYSIYRVFKVNCKANFEGI